MKVLVLGANGQLGKSILKLSKNMKDVNLTALTRKELDLSDLNSISEKLDTYQVDVVINAAAYTAVDRAEEEKELADTINHLAVKIIGEWCVNQNVKLIHVSTDYVFDGESETPYKEDDVTNPINAYGLSKLNGEKALLAMSNGNIFIVRTSWVWSEFGSNFVKTMLRLGKEKDSLNVVNDQYGCPTYAGDLALVLLRMATMQNKKDAPSIYHFCNKGKTTWYSFAKAIMAYSNTNCTINGIPTTEYPTPAKRAKYTVLDTNKIQSELFMPVAKWEESLKFVLHFVEVA